MPTEEEEFAAYYQKNRIPHRFDEKRIAEVAARRGVTEEEVLKEIDEHDKAEWLRGLSIEWEIERRELNARLDEAIHKLETDGYAVEKGNPHCDPGCRPEFVPVCKVISPSGDPEYCLPFDLVKFALLRVPKLNAESFDPVKWQAHLEERFRKGAVRSAAEKKLDEALDDAERLISQFKQPRQKK